MGDIVNLNVGGVYFVTRRTTLAQSSSFFSGLIATHPDADDIFVDRDPTHFRHVLNWMRGVTYLPEDEGVLKELTFEAEYYAMQHMLSILKSTRGISLHRAAQTMANSSR